ncbi:MAG: hypothetical protein B0D92_04815 [Spirochaeta sp. LUC14_002_19_P3]|nr:MAG: hypothetical protein B0D92_04815 [Spirochaeta sp. LUC14_002_19_P3]
MPVSAGAFQLRVASPSPGIAVNPVGAPGALSSGIFPPLVGGHPIKIKDNAVTTRTAETVGNFFDLKKFIFMV